MSQLLTRLVGDLPPEWAAIPPEILAYLAPVNVRTLITPRGNQKVVSAEGVMTPEQKKVVDAILSSRWFLVTNGGVVPKARCGRCKRFHKYLTLACIEKPYNGLTEIVGLIERTNPIGTERIRIGTRQYRERTMTETTVDGVEFGAVVPISDDEALRLINAISPKVAGGWQGPIPDPTRGILVPA